MSLSISALSSSFAALSFSSQLSSKPNSPLSFVSFGKKSSQSALARKIPRLVVIASAAVAAADELETTSVEKYVKSRLPGGIAAQRIIGTGRRKCAIARVVLQEGTGKVFINYKNAQEYLQGNPLWLHYVKTPLRTLGFENNFDLFVKAHGGGLSGQAQAISLGVARALLKVSADYRTPLKRAGLLTRDARVVERKKVGLKKARKAPQYSKR